jgi:asparagine synthase (glutamine-hydrolysing)
MEAKEQFSDGGYNWINQLIAYCASQVTDEQLVQLQNFRTIPITKEAYFTDPSLISTIPS